VEELAVARTVEVGVVRTVEVERSVAAGKLGAKLRVRLERHRIPGPERLRLVLDSI
jgi:hypothetical protein